LPALIFAEALLLGGSDFAVLEKGLRNSTNLEKLAEFKPSFNIFDIF